MHAQWTRARIRSLSLVVVAGSALAAGAEPACAQEDRGVVDRRPSVLGPVLASDLRTRPTDPGGSDGPFPSSGVTLLSWLPLNSFPGSPTSAADCWGYTSPSGREYAIVGLRNGTSFVEVTNPTAPVQVGFITGPVSLWKDQALLGPYCYSVSEGGQGVQIIDMTQIDSGTVTLVPGGAGGGHSSTHSILSNQASNYLYLCGSNLSGGGLVAVNANNPTSLSIAGAWSNNYVHECVPISYTTGPLAGKEIVYCFNGGAGLEVIDATNKAAMVKIGGLVYPQTSYCHQGWYSPDLKYLYLNDEGDEQSFGAPTLTRIVDIQNPATPVLVGTFGNGLTSIDHNLYVRGTLIYEGNYTTGLRVWDAINPLAPVEIAWIDTHPESNSISFDGVWGNYPYFASGTVLISDIQRGLIVLRVGAISFAFPNGTPSMLAPNAATPLTVDLNPVLVQLDPGSVRLHVSVNGGAFSEIPMVHQGNNRFVADIPGAPCLAAVDYYVAAQTTGPSPQTFTSPSAAPATTYSAQVQTGSTVVAQDDFESATPWTVQNDPGLTAGGWVRADPNGTTNGGTPANPEDDHTPAPGVQCFFTGQGTPGGAAGAADVDGGPTRLSSPVFDMAAQPEARIAYFRWFYNSTGEDMLIAEVSNNGGTTWTMVETVTGGSGGWVQHEFRVADFVPPTNSVRLRFSTADVPNNSIVEAAVDDLVIAAPVCEDCYPDCDASGTLTVADFGCFQTKFVAGDPYADCNQSGSLTVADFGCFQTRFVKGCP